MFVRYITDTGRATQFITKGYEDGTVRLDVMSAPDIYLAHDLTIEEATDLLTKLAISIQTARGE